MLSNKRLPIYVATLLFFGIPQQLISQVSNYNFTQGAAMYVPITGGTVLVNGTSGTPAADDEIFVENTIGFDFKFNGILFTKFGVNSNGFAWLGSGEAASSTYNPLSNASDNLDGTGTINGVISPLGNDLLKSTGSPFGELRFETIGSAPNRICVIQFKNWRGYLLGTQARYNFQIRLHETSDKIEFAYGSFTTTGATASSAFEVGLRGASNNDFKNIVCANAGWANAVPGTDPADGSTISSIIAPADGTLFTWLPGAAPSCERPANISIVAISPTSDSIYWNKIANAQNYEWTVSSSATPPASGTATTTNNDTVVLVTDLTAGTQYYFHVRATCGSGDFSTWATRTFTTLRLNDRCADAIDITDKIGNNLADTAEKATRIVAGIAGSPANAPCSNTSSGGVNDVWYKFVAPAGGDSLIIAGQAGNSSDWVFQLFEACGGTQLACNDDGDLDNPFGNALMPVIGSCGLTPGSTYYLRTYPFSASTTATAAVYVYKGGRCPQPPANDVCSNADDIQNTCLAPLAGTTVNASSSSLPNTLCGSQFANQTDVWYKFNTGNSMIVPYIKITNIDTTRGKEVFLALYHGSDCNNLIYDGCLEAAPLEDSITGYLYGANSNTDYYIRVYSLGAANQTSFNISLCDSTSIVGVDTSGSGNCLNLGSLTISAANQNHNKWVRIIERGLLCEINANGNDLGSTNFRTYRNVSGNIRRDSSRIAPSLGREYLDRNLVITPTNQPTTPVGIRLYFTQQELDALIAAGGDGYGDVTGINTLLATKNNQGCDSVFSGSLSSGILLTPITNSSIGGPIAGYYLEFQTPSFSQFWIHGPQSSGPLPISIVHFSATRNGRSNLLKWTTAQETNANEFVVESSRDGVRFSRLGSVAASGTRASEQHYSFTDLAPASGINYYRLQMKERNAEIKYSPIRSVRNAGTADVALFPNPAKDQVQLLINSDVKDRASVQVLDMNGKLIYQQNTLINTGMNNLRLNIDKFAPGTYVLKLHLNNDSIVRKFNKQ
jgi:hypothetical protein